MNKDNEIELVQTIQEKDRKIKELETINENITRELLSRTEKLSEVIEKLKGSVPKDKIREKIQKLENGEQCYYEFSTGDLVDLLKELLEEE